MQNQCKQKTTCQAQSAVTPLASRRVHLVRRRNCEPTLERYGCPDAFDQTEWPCALEEAVHGTETTGDGETEDEPVASGFECVTNEHGGHRKEAKRAENTHGSLSGQHR